MEKVDNYEFTIGDKFLCYHGPLLYVAKCLNKRTTSDGKIQYYIHYNGWNSRWDEWVDTTRILPINAVNMVKMESLEQIHSSKNKNKRTSIKVKRTSQIDISSKSIQCVNVPLSKTPKPNKKRDRVPLSSDKLSLDEIKSKNKAVKEVDEGTGIVNVAKSAVATKTIENSITDSIASKSIHVIDIPSVLKRTLAYDYLMIREHNKMIKFQKSNTVEKLIYDYTSSKSTFCDKSLYIGLTLIQYFNTNINTELLYTEESENNIHKKAIECLQKRLENGEISSINHLEFLYPKKYYHYIYAPIYLLRLFVKLMGLIKASQKFTDDQLNTIVSGLEDFLKYVENNHEQYFSENNYE